MFPQLELLPVELPAGTQRLRHEVRAFLRQCRERGLFTPACDAWLSGFSAEFSREVGRRGWIGMTWPKAYGGGERSGLERFVVTEEFLAAGAPVAAHWIADRQSGTLLLRFGTEEQKRFFLPRIAAGECYFAIGMSEPDAGSDLAGLRTRADRSNGGWVLNGRKIWTSNAHHCHYLIVLCRTAPPSEDRHAGMSQFIVDLRAPGVTVRPIPIITGASHFNEVTFDNVHIPAEHLVGEEGNGWRQVLTELAFERSGPERFMSTYPLLAELARRLAEGGDSDAAVQVEIGRLISRLWSLRRMSLSVAGMLDRGRVPEQVAPLIKDLGTRYERQVAEVAGRLLPVEPSLQAGDSYEALLAQSILHAPGFTLRGGTTEILRSIVARGLGLR